MLIIVECVGLVVFVAAGLLLCAVAGWRLGVLEGVGAVWWPNNPHFRSARNFINSTLVKRGHPTIEEIAAQADVLRAEEWRE
jgi:hypothetical protein